MALVRHGEARAFEVIYDRHCGVAFSLAYRMCGTRSAAEDVVQEAFLSLWRSGARYDRTRGSVRTWVLGIVHNRAIDALRRSVKHDRRRASDEGIEERFEAPERTDVEVGAPRRGARDPRRARRAPRGAEPRDRARILRRLHAHRDRRRCSTRRSGRSRGGCGSGWRRCDGRSRAQGWWSRDDRARRSQRGLRRLRARARSRSRRRSAASST